MPELDDAIMENEEEILLSNTSQTEDASLTDIDKEQLTENDEAAVESEELEVEEELDNQEASITSIEGSNQSDEACEEDLGNLQTLENYRTSPIFANHISLFLIIALVSFLSKYIVNKVSEDEKVDEFKSILNFLFYFSVFLASFILTTSQITVKNVNNLEFSFYIGCVSLFVSSIYIITYVKMFFKKDNK